MIFLEKNKRSSLEKSSTLPAYLELRPALERTYTSRAEASQSLIEREDPEDDNEIDGDSGRPDSWTSEDSILDDPQHKLKRLPSFEGI